MDQDRVKFDGVEYVFIESPIDDFCMGCAFELKKCYFCYNMPCHPVIRFDKKNGYFKKIKQYESR